MFAALAKKLYFTPAAAAAVGKKQETEVVLVGGKKEVRVSGGAKTNVSQTDAEGLCNATEEIMREIHGADPENTKTKRE